MKQYKLIAFEDLQLIAEYFDDVSKLFPTGAIESLREAKVKAIGALGRTMDAGNEGLIHAKLDAIVASLEIINGRADLAEALLGPMPVKRAEPVIRSGNATPKPRFPRNIAELEADLPGRDLEFDNEGGGHE